MASDGDHIYLSRKAVLEELARFYAIASVGVASQTSGKKKLAEAHVRAGALVAEMRSRSRIGVNHKEQVAVLSVDMRGSTALAAANDAERMFVLMQCFIPLLVFVATKLDGEVIGLRGDGLLVAFGIGEDKWRPCLNRAYEAGMIMIEANRDVLTPFLRKKQFPTSKGVGVGIDCGEVTITKIGLGDALEVTAYGAAVNRAAKDSKLTDQVWLSAEANRRLHKKEVENTFTPKVRRLVEIPILNAPVVRPTR